MDYKNLYLIYKNKYLNLKNISGGMDHSKSEAATSGKSKLKRRIQSLGPMKPLEEKSIDEDIDRIRQIEYYLRKMTGEMAYKIFDRVDTIPNLQIHEINESNIEEFILGNKKNLGLVNMFNGEEIPNIDLKDPIEQLKSTLSKKEREIIIITGPDELLRYSYNFFYKSSGLSRSTGLEGIWLPMDIKPFEFDPFSKIIRFKKPEDHFIHNSLHKYNPIDEITIDTIEVYMRFMNARNASICKTLTLNYDTIEKI